MDYTKGERGKAPEVLHQYNLWEVAKTSYDEEEVIAAVKEMQRIHIENIMDLWYPGSDAAPITTKGANIPDTGDGLGLGLFGCYVRSILFR